MSKYCRGGPKRVVPSCGCDLALPGCDSAAMASHDADASKAVRAVGSVGERRGSVRVGRARRGIGAM